MQNKRTKRTSHKPLHLYAFGDNLNKISDKLSGNLSDKGANLLNSVGSLATGASQALTGGNSTGVGNAMNTIGSLASNIPGIGGIVGAGIETLGNLVNAAFGSNINEENVQNIQNTNMNMRNLSVDQSSFDNLLAQQASTTPLGTIDQSEVGTDGWFSNKAKNLTADLNKKREAANLAAQNAFATGAENIENSQLQGLLSNYMAKGGKIYIKPSKRGTFTAAAKKHGKGVQEFARQVLANKDKYSSAMIKKANFARNASKWHDDGGNLETLIQSINNRSNANFVKRLLDPNRSYIQDWENPTNIATHKLSYATDDGKYIVYPEVQSINGTALGYARPDQSGFKDRGRIAKIRFNTDFSGDDVGEWLLKNDFRPHENDFYTTYALPYLVKYSHSPSKDFRAIQGPLLDRYDNLFEYSVDHYKDIKDRVEDFRSTLPEDVAKYLPKFRRDDNIKNKIYNEMLGRHILKEIMPFSELNEIKRAIGKFNSKAAKDLRNKNFKGNYNLKTKMLWREINSGEDIREFVSQHVLPNYKNQLIKLGTSPKATNRLSSNPYQHFLKTGPIGEKVADFVEEIPLDLLDRNSLYISRGHSNKYTKGLSRKARKYGGDLYLIDEHDTVADIGMPNLYKNGGKMNTHGANFTNGIKTINEGGLHETNPLSGVPMGIAPDGEPNLVEQGEVIYNNYVYSNRLFPTKKVLQEAGLPTKYSNYSFAYIAEKLSKESEERTNDPISANGLRDNMNRLQKAQEAYKELSKIRKSSNKYSKGGHLYDGEDTSFIFTGEDGFRYRVPYTGAEPAEMELIREEPLARLKNSSINLNPNINPDLSNLHEPTTIDPKYSIPTPSERGLSQQEIDDWMDEDSKSLRRSTIGRYAPIMGSAINVLTDTLGITNKADYSNPNMIGNAASRIRNVSYTPVNNYLTYNPLDRNYYMNQLRSQAAATRRAITNQSGGNRATAMAALLAADNNAQLQAGNLARQAEEYNRAQKERVETFNRGTHQLNSEGAMRASLANQQADQIRLNAALAQAQMQEEIDRTVSANKSANTNNFLQNLSDLGRENMQYNWLQDLIDSGAIKSFRRGGKLKNRRK